MSTRIDFSTLDLMDALDLAVLVEQEAQERYNYFNEQIGRRYAVDAASIFELMAGNEEKHGRQLAHRRRELFGDKPVRVSRNALFDVEAPEFGAPRWNMSPLKAFQLALASEEKAYWFYDEAMKHVKDAKVRALFAELRDEETEHVRMVKEAIAKLPPGADKDLEDVDA
ncbi:MAG: rubrerythrin [Betaproteobacteria bacterium RIFCSPLOWO2_12_FULL_63_13]|nr:MAG: rubrerythrin [Betaproteobacteria bacterium RIFCSPLOWO2_02_FULL_63_19]OGA42548.1 MAG: rubrerythrin [Betaproteobacteria bacterium RIFCSPLOWO2_12_FULL_63_13]